MANNWLRTLSGREEQNDIPERVRTAISDQQNSSERLIGWIQLAVVLTFGVLYAISPKTFPEHVTFEPVPVVLSVYFAFTIFSLVAELSQIIARFCHRAIGHCRRFIVVFNHLQFSYPI